MALLQCFLLPRHEIPIQRPLEAVDAVGEDLEEAVHDPIPLLRIDLLAEVHRAL
jgi:hypothetical protein